MAEETINERLIKEGQLTRNTGTNSIKSVNINLDKFSKVFSSMERQLVMQSSFLESIYNQNIAAFNLEKDKIADEERRRAQLESMASDDAGASTNNAATAPDMGKVKATEEQKESLLSGMIPGIGNMLGSFFGTAGGVSLAKMAPKLLRGGLLAYVAGPVGDYVTGFVEEGMKSLNLGTSEEFNKGLADNLGNAASAATIGMIFGKKYALLFGAGTLIGGMVSDALGIGPDDEFLPNSAIAQAIKNSFGASLKTEDLVNVGAMVGLAFGPGLITKLFKSEIIGDGAGGAGGPAGGAGGAGGAGSGGSKLKNAFKRGFKGIGWGLAFQALGTIAAEGIRDATGSDNLGDAAQWITDGASLGVMFGPTGALVGALAGLAAFGYTKLVDWVDDYGKKKMEEITEEIEDKLNAADAALKAGDVAGAQKAIDIAQANNFQGVATKEQNDAILNTSLDVAAQQRAAGKDTTGALGYAAREAIKEDFTKKRDINKGTSEDQQQLAFEAMQRMVDNKLTENLETARLSLLGGQSLLSREVKKNLEKLQQEFLPPEMRSIPDTSTPVEETTTTTALTPQAQRRANQLAMEEAKKQKLLSQSVGENLERLEKFKENSTSAPIIVPVPLPSGGPPGTGAPSSTVVNNTTVISKTDPSSSLNSNQNQLNITRRGRR
jgi:hypothetical protein